MCSLRRSISTWPGMRRSPVNSAKLFLQLFPQERIGARRAFGANPGVDLHPAPEVDVAVDLALGTAHLQGHGVVDPVAHLVADQRAVGDGGRKRKRRRVQL